MANPEHRPVLTGFDMASVMIYRGAVLLFGLSLPIWCIMAFAFGGGHADRAGLVAAPLMAAVILSGIAALFIHVYVKTIRRIFQILGIAALLLGIGYPFVGANLILSQGGLDGIQVLELWRIGAACNAAGIMGAVYYKESFCFKIPAVWLMICALVGLVPASAIQEAWAPLFSVPAGIGIVYLGIMKIKMPLDYDIGNKSAYQR